MKLRTLFTLAVAIACCGAGIASAGQGHGKSKKDKDRAEAVSHGPRDDRDAYFERHGHTRLDIPKGHYPPPGECRIWYPGRPPGHQPPPMKCGRAESQVPPGAWVIRHPREDPDHVHVVVYDEQRPGSVFVVGQFKIATGVFVRVVVNR